MSFSVMLQEIDSTTYTSMQNLLKRLQNLQVSFSFPSRAKLNIESLLNRGKCLFPGYFLREAISFNFSD